MKILLRPYMEAELGKKLNMSLYAVYVQLGHRNVFVNCVEGGNTIWYSVLYSTNHVSF